MKPVQLKNNVDFVLSEARFSAPNCSSVYDAYRGLRLTHNRPNWRHKL